MPPVETERTTKGNQIMTNETAATTTQPEINLNLRMGLGNLVAELQRRMESRVDVIADTRQMEIIVRDGQFVLAANAGTPLTEWMDTVKDDKSGGMVVEAQAIGQILEKCDISIPKLFADKLAQKHPVWAAELCTNLLRASGTTRMVRMMDGKVRAFLSDSYRCLDNYDLAASALQTARDSGAEVLECQLTPTRMELKLVNRSVWDAVDTFQRNEGGGYAAAANHKWIRDVGFNGGATLPGGPNTVHPLVTVGNSETGHGGYYVKYGVFQGLCCNGAIIRKEMGQVHLGKRQTIPGILKADTLRAEADFIHKSARDFIAAGFTKAQFEKLTATFKAAAETAIVNPKPVMDFCVEQGIFTAEQRDDIFAHFIRDYKPTVLGLASAMTRQAQEYVDADVANTLEESAGAVIQNPKQFAKLVTA